MNSLWKKTYSSCWNKPVFTVSNLLSLALLSLLFLCYLNNISWLQMGFFELKLGLWWKKISKRKVLITDIQSCGQASYCQNFAMPCSSFQLDNQEVGHIECYFFSWKATWGSLFCTTSWFYLFHLTKSCCLGIIRLLMALNRLQEPCFQNFLPFFSL